jgi:hypothetical protein
VRTDRRGRAPCARAFPPEPGAAGSVRRVRSGRAVRGAALVVGGVLALAACGGGDDPLGSASPGPSASASGSPSSASREELPDDLPRPAVPLGQTVTEFDTALRTGECAEIGVFVTARQRDPAAALGSRPDAEECAELEKFLNPLTAFRPGAHEEFGTAAVVDGTLNDSIATTVWVLDADRRWRIDPTAYVYPTPEDPDVHSVGTAPRPNNRFAENARDWVAAWRAGECAQAYRLTDPFSAFVADNGGSEEGFCRLVTESFSGDGIGRMLAANPSAEPQFLGAVDQYGFSLLRSVDGSLFTIVSIVQATNASSAERAAHANYAVYNIYRAKAADPSRPTAEPAVSAPPTEEPTDEPSAEPSAAPSEEPSEEPSAQPSGMPQAPS